MAYIKHLWLHESDIGRQQLTAHTKLKPAGEAQVKVPIPKVLYDALWGLAQTAADAHEAQMRAEIVSDDYRKETNNDAK